LITVFGADEVLETKGKSPLQQIMDSAQQYETIMEQHGVSHVRIARPQTQKAGSAAANMTRQ
jgi:hypothetical protein